MAETRATRCRKKPWDAREDRLSDLDALRDAERELFAGTNPLLKRILRQIRDAGKTAQERAQKDKEFRQLSTQLGARLRLSSQPRPGSFRSSPIRAR